MYHTKIFKQSFENSIFLVIDPADIDKWLNSFKNSYIVGYAAAHGELCITIIERPLSTTFPLTPYTNVKRDIDETFEDKSINYESNTTS